MLKIKDKKDIDEKKLQNDIQLLSIAVNCSQQSIKKELLENQQATFEFKDFIVQISLVEKVEDK